MDRRDFLKASAAASSFAFADLDELYAQAGCDVLALDEVDGTGSTSVAEDEFWYWLDGPFTSQFQSKSGPVKVKLALREEREQRTNDYVEAVYLCHGGTNAIVAAQTLEPESRDSQGHMPYVIFENLQLDPASSDGYFIYLVSRATSPSGAQTVSVRRVTLRQVNIRQSRLEYSHLASTFRNKYLPAQFLTDMADSHHGFEYADTLASSRPDLAGRGFLTTPYQHFAGNPTHNVRAKVEYIDTTGEKDGRGDPSFKIHVGKMHNDLGDETHYMRYFLVLDPVGRVLGGLRREYPTAASTTSDNIADADGRTNVAIPVATRKSQASHLITNDFVVEDTQSTGLDLSSASSFAHLKIRDCPYIQILTEDNYDAMARVTIRLR